MSNTILQQRLWRWHFWAGLLSLPLALVLAVSGGIYLFKPQYEQWFEQRLESGLSHVDTAPISNDTLLAKLQQQYPDTHLKQFTLARPSDRSVEFELVIDGEIHKLWVDRFSGELLHSQLKRQELMQWIKHLHGELKLGNKGSYVVELMAQWMIVLIITGLALQLSRQKNAAYGNWTLALQRTFFPTLHLGTKLFWRRFHALLGVWLSLFLLLLLISGLPWTQVWGGGFQQLQKVMGWDGPGQEWFVTLQSQTSPRAIIPAENLWAIRSSESNVRSTESEHSRDSMGVTLDQIVHKVTPMQLPSPVIVLPPKGENGVWTVRSMTPNRPERVTLHFDRWSGNEIASVRFEDYHPVKQVVSYGIALHEGALFGWLNQLLGLLTALGLVGIVISGGKMWWQRRPQGQLASPPLMPGKIPRMVWCTATLLGLLLPLFAASALLVLLMDRLVRLFQEQQSGSISASENE